MGMIPEDRNVFTRRWEAFVVGLGLDPATSSAQLLQCVSDDLGNGLLKTDPAIVSKHTADAMAMMKA